jgi:hypothetical protein
VNVLIAEFETFSHFSDSFGGKAAHVLKKHCHEDAEET